MSSENGGRDTVSLVNKIFNLNLLKFKHVYGAPEKKENCYDNVKITKNANDSQFCAVNPKFIAVVTESSGGGCFIVIPIDQTGRLDLNYGRVIGHKGPVLDIKWNPFNDNVIASCSDDCTIKVWQIPDQGLALRPLADPLITLAEHKRRVSMIEWHPTADGVLFSVGFDHQILVWKVHTGQLIQTLDCHPDTVQSISLNRDGSLLATTCKDKRIRIIEPRSGRVLAQGPGHQGSKSSKIVFLGDTGRLLSTGFSRYSDRQWAVWSQFDLEKPLTIENIDCSSGVLFPFYDHDTKMVYIAGKGDGSIRYYEIVTEPPWCHYISQFITGFPQRGLGCMPKRGLDTSRCEVFRFYKLHAMKCMVEPISMILPRKSNLFQADVYPDTAAPIPAMTADEWIMGKNRNPVLMSMKTGSTDKTNKPMIQSATSLNNDRKFIFITQENNIDYRSKDEQQQPRQSNDAKRLSGFLNSSTIASNKSSMNGSSNHINRSSSGSSISNGSARSFQNLSNNGSPYHVLQDQNSNGNSARSSSPYRSPSSGLVTGSGRFDSWPNQRSTDEFNYINELIPTHHLPDISKHSHFQNNHLPHHSSLDDSSLNDLRDEKRKRALNNGYLRRSSTGQYLNEEHYPRNYDELLILYKHKLDEIQILRELNAKKDLKIKELEDQLDDFRFDES